MVQIEVRPHLPQQSSYGPIGILDETDRLQLAVTWGPVGVEAFLAQLFPPAVSCFYDAMDVPQARRECLDFAAMLEQFGVHVICLRDELAMLLSVHNHPRRLNLIDLLCGKGRSIAQRFDRSLPSNFACVVADSVALDMHRYGEESALALNYHLFLAAGIPLGNLLYTRDPMNVLLGMRFMGVMPMPIRRQEVELSEQVFQQGLQLAPPVGMLWGETFEGGDGYTHNGWVHVGVGARTTIGATRHIYQTFRPELERHGLQFAVVQDLDVSERSNGDRMRYMHLDTFSSPVGKQQILVFEAEAERRTVSRLHTNRQGTTVIEPTHRTFLGHLEGLGEEIIGVPDDEQQEFSCNLLALDDQTLFVPLSRNATTNNRLEAAGKTIVPVNLEACTLGYGAAHCMTGQLRRQQSEVGGLRCQSSSRNT